MTNGGHPNGNAPKKSSKKPKKKPEQPYLENHRTYTRLELVDRIPNCDDEFLSILIQLFGLIPMGKSQHIFSGENAIVALMNHAVGRVVPEQRRPIKRKQLREMLKQRKGNGDGEEEES